MGICISVASSDQIHNAESEHGHGNAVLFFDNQNDSTGIHGLCSVYSKEGSKGLNQDSAILYQGYGMKDGAFCGVFDGHGKNGHVVSEMVRNRLPLLLQSQKESVITKFNEDTDGKSVPEVEDCEKWKETVISAFKVMDKEIKLQDHLDFSCSGTTAVVAIRQGDDLIIANLGDSRAVLGTITENGIKAVQLTTDLKPGLPSEAERIRTCKGRVIALKNEPHIQRVWLPHEDVPGLAMSRAFGDFLLKDYGIIAIPDVSFHRLTSNDQFLVLATDGVWDVMSNDQVAAVVWEAATEEAAARAVVEAANAAWKRKFPAAKIDDCTVVCLFLQDKQRNHVVAVNKR
ncbi:putative protein phosphatase 2C 72 [Morus notabilis]|uniref:PPM-type phosphatase domain-containing protein n=1 Tax=Morus notabilis TaxID=981085 RepID=W9R3Q0_9ROSA|nr:probable protein phosphatase 2C 72 [Morus notabilis]EXB66891.1 putative protein phosphatase 2C 72 [Morus notabilis]